MSAAAISICEFIAAFVQCVPRGLHPFAQAVIAEDLAAMRAAADDAVEVLRLVRKISERVVRELSWEAESYESAGDHREAYRLRSRAQRYEARHG